MDIKDEGGRTFDDVIIYSGCYSLMRTDLHSVKQDTKMMSDRRNLKNGFSCTPEEFLRDEEYIMQTAHTVPVEYSKKINAAYKGIQKIDCGKSSCWLCCIPKEKLKTYTHIKRNCSIGVVRLIMQAQEFKMSCRRYDEVSKTTVELWYNPRTYVVATFEYGKDSVVINRRISFYLLSANEVITTSNCSKIFNPTRCIRWKNNTFGCDFDKWVDWVDIISMGPECDGYLAKSERNKFNTECSLSGANIQGLEEMLQTIID